MPPERRRPELTPVQALDGKLQEKLHQYEELEDAVLLVENEKAESAQRMQATSQQLVDESAKAQHLERELYQQQVELKAHRDNASQWERELAKADSEIKVRDSEIALLRSRENKTIVEHVHVLEQAKKMTDRQLSEQVKENSRLNTLMKSMETHRNRLTADVEDITRQYELLRASKGREARQARASLSAEDKDAAMALEDERQARRVAENRVASLEKDQQDQRRQLSTATLSPSRGGSSTESQLKKKTDELSRLESNFETTLSENERLHAEVTELKRHSRLPQTPTASSHSERANLLRGLQQSHDALGRDMSDQLRKLENQPLTPSRRHNSALSNGHTLVNSPDPMASKRIRSLETEINGLRQQLEDEKEEKDFLYSRMKELETGKRPDGKPPFPFEQAIYSHFRLKAKSLRSQLDQ